MNQETPTNKTDNSTDARRRQRRTIIAAGAAAAIGLFKISTGRHIYAQVPLNKDPTRIPGLPHGKVGTRSIYETLSKIPSETSSRSPLQNLYGIITPSDLHFERHHGGVPVINPENYSLTIHGMVKRQMKFSLSD